MRKITLNLALGLLMLLMGCEPELPDSAAFKIKADNYCKNCGGLSSGFINKYGLDIRCVDGTQLTQHYAVMPTNVILGNCK